MAAQQDPAGQDTRTALVIGNSTYLSGPLKNTVNDARAMATALESAGFKVFLYENVRNQNEMKKAVREFGIQLKTGGTALFYYSGHGMQVNGFNYLIPTQAVMNIQEEIEYEALDVGFIMAYMESAKSDVNIVILDACRNNPFARSFRDTRLGLTSMVAPAGTLIAYSTAPGSVASDGDTDYGLYTSALLAQMQEPGLKVEDVFKNVRAEVLDRSDGKQTPWESSSLVGDFYFHTSAQVQASHETAGNEAEDKNLSLQEVRKERYEEAVSKGIIPEEAIRRAGNKSGNKIAFRWKATADGTYYLMVEDRDISKETIHRIRGEHLYVYHPETRRVFILRFYIYRRDGQWHRGITFE
jgi:uncharacterized caspase-like protein